MKNYFSGESSSGLSEFRNKCNLVLKPLCIVPDNSSISSVISNSNNPLTMELSKTFAYFPFATRHTKSLYSFGINSERIELNN